jgi:putative transposase
VREKFKIISNAKKKNIPVSQLCKQANVSKSGYYYWIKVKENRILNDKQDLEIISKIFNSHKQKAGWRTIQMDLERKYQIKMNHKKIRRIMKEYDLITKVRKRNLYKMMAKKTQEHSICKNLLERDFKATKPFEKCSTDITYLYFGRSQKAYLSATRDLASGEIISYEPSQNLTLEFVDKMLDKLIETIPEEDLQGMLMHSDQGFHFTHPDYQTKLAKNEIIQSMSRKGNCLDNAPIESFFGHLKDELDYKYCETYEELVAKIEKYIYYYNNERYQWSRNKMTPVEYRSHLLNA